MPTVLVTGANRGLGLEFVKQYSRANWEVIGTCRDPGNAAEVSALAAASANIELHPLDVTDAEGIRSLAVSLSGRPIDLLLLNAGVMGASSTTLGDLDQADFLHSMNVNTVVPALMVQAFRQHVKASEKKLIVGISSILGSIDGNSDGGLYSYRASKAGLNAVLRSASNDLHDDGITVIAMHPGWVQTDMGGENATITPAVSISGMREVIDGLHIGNSGHFLAYDGSELPW
jgi:NAD(P)-dependent dehydrogenase (short-subunit alcohol dehydrogenase family)